MELILLHIIPCTEARFCRLLQHTIGKPVLHCTCICRAEYKATYRIGAGVRVVSSARRNNAAPRWTRQGQASRPRRNGRRRARTPKRMTRAARPARRTTRGITECRGRHAAAGPVQVVAPAVVGAARACGSAGVSVHPWECVRHETAGRRQHAESNRTHSIDSGRKLQAAASFDPVVTSIMKRIF